MVEGGTGCRGTHSRVDAPVTICEWIRCLLSCLQPDCAWGEGAAGGRGREDDWGTGT